MPQGLSRSADALTQRVPASTARPAALEREAKMFKRGRDALVELREASVELWWADLSATAQPRLWLTTSMLCPSGSSTNAP
jgi:hypothetical protein